LLSNYLLAAKVVRDQRKFRLGHQYANQAVRVAKATKDTDLIATALYTRGCTYLAWGRNGTLENGVFQVQLDKINKAIRDFEDAKKAAENTEKSIHPQLLGFIDMHLSRAYAIRNLSTGEKVPTLAFTLLDDAEEKIDRESIDDPYERELVIGSQIGFIRGIYHNNKAVDLTIAGMPGAALKEIKTLEGLRQGAIGKDLTREQAWLDIVAAEAYMGLEEYKKAVERAKIALVVSNDINSVTNLARVVDIHGRLLQSPYKDKASVKELGDMIHETITHNLEQEEEQLVEEQDY
jgi:tetratricopeptide (TPR) repeat protein